MKQIRLLVILVLFSLPLLAQSGLAISCAHDGTYPSCDGGEFEFTGSNFPAQVHVKVTNSDGTIIDEGDYVTDNGVLTFTENLSFADTYTISLDQKVVLSITTS